MENENTQISWPGWEVVRLIGRGSFGAVYEIERDIFGKTEKAALKVIRIPQNNSDIEELYNIGYDDESITSTFQSHLQSIVSEYTIMREMNGSLNVVNCEDIRYVQHDDGIGWDIYIKMELLTPLTRALPRQIPEETVIKLARDLCAALMMCREYGIVHRDIKPQNIFVSRHGDYKLGDFGIAKTVEKTMGGTKIGTYNYMAPEVYNNQPYGSAVDIYSLGLVLYWMLNERRMPFLPLPPAKLTSGMDEKARLRRLTGEQLPAPAHGSEELKRIVLKACAYDVKDRYHSAEEMMEDLNRLIGYYPLGRPEMVAQSQPEESLEETVEATAATERAGTYCVEDTKPAPQPESEATQREPEATQPQEPVKRFDEPAVAAVPEAPKPQPEDYAQEKKKKPLWIGLLAGVAAVVLLVVLMMRGCGENAVKEPEDMLPGESQSEGPVETKPVMRAPIVDVDANWIHVVALREDGTVDVVAEDRYRNIGHDDTADWADITAVCAGYFHTVGLKADGTVVAVGANSYGQCDVSDWTDIVAITAGDYFTVGLKADGTLVAVGENERGQCDVSELTNIVQIDAQGSVLECLDADGNWFRLGETSWHKDNGTNLGIAALGTGYYNSVGLKPDGTAKFLKKDNEAMDISDWSNLVEVCPGGTHVLGLRSDGTVLAEGENPYGECDVSGWTDIVTISASFGYSVGVKADGTVVATGKYMNSGAPCDVSALNENTKTKPIDRVYGLSIRSTYAMGETLDADTLDLHVVYQSGKKKPISSGYSCTPSVLDHAGSQQITVSYGGITETFDVEVLDFYELEARISNNYDDNYNTNGNVYWVLYICPRYKGNFVDYKLSDNFEVSGGFSGDFSEDWINAKRGNSARWTYGASGPLESGLYGAGYGVILPDDPEFAGDYSVSVVFGDLTKTVTFTLVYNGDYDSGTGWSLANVNWT